MDRLNNYNGSIDLISGLRAKNSGVFPLMEAHDIQVDEDGTRLDEKLQSIERGAGLLSFVREWNFNNWTIKNDASKNAISDADSLVIIKEIGSFMRANHAKVVSIVFTINIQGLPNFNSIVLAANYFNGEDIGIHNNIQGIFIASSNPIEVGCFELALDDGVLKCSIPENNQSIIDNNSIGSIRINYMP